MDDENPFELYTTKFSDYVKDLRKAEKFPVDRLFCAGRGVIGVIKELKKKNDFKGLYAFWVAEKAEYVGISGKVIDRLNQHIKGSTHHSATLPIKILQTEYSGKYDTFARKEFIKEFLMISQNEHINKMQVSFIEIEDDIELYLFEVYCAVTFKCKYNSFKTH